MVIEKSSASKAKKFAKICVWSGIFLLTLLICMYIFRNPLTAVLVESVAGDNQIELECLDWNLTFSRVIEINEICVSTDAVAINAKNATLSFKQNRLDIKEMVVSHLKSTTNSAKQESSLDQEKNYDLNEFTLPNNLPLIKIVSLHLQSYLLDKAIALSVDQPSANSLRLSGDIDATLDLIKTQAATSIDISIGWQPSDILAVLPDLEKTIDGFRPYLKEHNWRSQPIASHISFDGASLSTVNNLSISETIEYQDCMFDMFAKGKVITKTAIADMSSSLDISQFPINASVPSCVGQQLRDYGVEFERLTFKTSNQIEISPALISLAEADIEAYSPSSEKLAVKVTNASFDIPSQDAQADYSVHIDTSIMSSQLKGEAKLTSTGTARWNDRQLQAELTNNQIEINNAVVQGESEMKIGNISSVFSGQYQNAQLAGKGDITIGNLRLLSEKQAPAEKLAPTLTIKQVKNQWSLVDERISATSQINAIKAQHVLIKSVDVKHDLTLKPSGEEKRAMTSEGEHLFRVNSGTSSGISTGVGAGVSSGIISSTVGMLRHRIDRENKQIDMTLDDQSILTLQPLLVQFDPQAKLLTGRFAANLNYDLVSENGKGNISFSDVNLDYGEYKVRSAQVSETFTVNSAELQLPAANLHIDLVDVGVPIRNISAVISAQQNTFKLLSADGDIFGGRFTLGELFLDGRDQKILISASDLQLAELAKLQQQSGIDVTGKIGGDLPLLITAGLPKIVDGTLVSETPGVLKIENNPAFNSIKENQQQLELLENLHFDNLKTKVTLAPDGLLKTEFSISGRNPDKNQAVNFNYGQEQNIFTLLKVLRISDSVQQGIEDKIEKKYSDKSNANKGNQ